MFNRFDDLVSKPQNPSDFINNHLQQEAEARRHAESIMAHMKIAESNNQIAEEAHNIRETLQAQISDNREQIKESKTTEKKLAKRSWWQFSLSFGVSLISAATAIVALIISLCK